MKKAIFLLLSAAMFVGCLPVCQAQDFTREKKIGDHDTNYNSGQRLDALAIPTDQKPWLTVVVSDDYENHPRDKEVYTWFYIHPRLMKIRESVNFTCMRVSDPRYASAKEAGGMGSAYGNVTPAIGLTRAVQFPGEKNLPKLMFAYEGGPMMGYALKNPDVLADVLYEKLSAAYPAPKFAGQSERTPIEAGPCPPDGCQPPVYPKPFVNPNPVVQPLEVGPSDHSDVAMVFVVAGGFGMLALILAVGVVLVAKRQTPTPASEVI